MIGFDFLSIVNDLPVFYLCLDVKIIIFPDCVMVIILSFDCVTNQPYMMHNHHQNHSNTHHHQPYCNL